MRLLSPSRRGTVSLVILLALLLLASTSRAAEYVSVNKDGVNIRSGPGVENEILWEVFASFPLQVLKRTNDWAEVIDFEGDKGWIYAPLLDKEKTVIVKSDSVNMRSGPGTDSPVIATVKQGVVFKPLEKKNGWVKVSHKDDLTGWILGELLWPND